MAIPKDVADLIRRCWPDGVIEEFDTYESWFHEVRRAIERDLSAMEGVTMRWRTPVSANPDEQVEPPWQSYHLMFVAPNADDFAFESETFDTEDETVTVRGKGWWGWAVGIFLKEPVAAIRLSQYEEFEDGSTAEPDLDTGAGGELNEAERKALLELRLRIAAALPLTGLAVEEDVFLDLPLRVQNAFFFRGA